MHHQSEISDIDLAGNMPVAVVSAAVGQQSQHQQHSPTAEQHARHVYVSVLQGRRRDEGLLIHVPV